MPSAAVLHYAQEIFEGLKAYRHADGSIWTFRPEANAARFNRSARRLTLPELPEADFLAALDKIITDMHTDGTLSAMSNKWFKADLTTPPAP